MRSRRCHGYFCIALSLVVTRDARADNVVFPKNDYVKSVTTVFGAKGDGKADDTQALQKAFSDRTGIIYLPNGTYRITGPIATPAYGLGPWVYGQSRDGVILKLDDGAPGFGDPKNPQTVLAAIKLAPGAHLSADHFFRQWNNFTVDAGNNPGAIGVRYYSNNSGQLNRVVIRGTGVLGLDLGFTDQNGPLLIQDVEVSGFDVGVSTSNGLNSQTISGMNIHDCRSVGLSSSGQNLSVDRLVTNNTPTAISTDSMFVLINGHFMGGGADKPAIDYRGSSLFARNVHVEGFSTILAGKGKMVPGPALAEWVADGPDHGFDDSLTTSLRLPVRLPPALPWEEDPAKWECVGAHGAKPGDNQDDTKAFQATIDAAAAAGKTTVCIEPGIGNDPNWYNLSAEVHVHGSVRHVIGLGFGRIRASNSVGFVLDADAAPIVKFENQYAFAPGGRLYRNNDTSTMIVESSEGLFLDLKGKGDVFLQNSGGEVHISNSGAHVWARQLNTEGNTLDSDNQGAKLWVLGLKTELGGTKIRTTGGGMSELLGAHIYNTCAHPTVPLFVIEDSYATFAGVRETIFCSGGEYKTHVSETRAGTTHTFQKSGRAFSLYTGAPSNAEVCKGDAANCNCLDWDEDGICDSDDPCPYGAAGCGAKDGPDAALGGGPDASPGNAPGSDSGSPTGNTGAVAEAGSGPGTTASDGGNASGRRGDADDPGGADSDVNGGCSCEVGIGGPSGRRSIFVLALALMALVRRTATRIRRLGLLLSTLVLGGCAGQVGGEGNQPAASSQTTPPNVADAPPARGAQPAAAPSPMSSPSASVTQMQPMGGTRGIFQCPTVPPPSYGATALNGLSATFKQTCANCHGGAGQGSALYPAIPGKLDEQAFVDRVRKGIRVMPAFPAAFVSDDDLRSDFAILTSRADLPPSSAGLTGSEWDWTEDQVQDVYARGLAMWRQADAQGAACANCHSPDGIDLAVIGYPDATILRRAYLHLTPADALVVRDFIHAQRRRFAIQEPCDPSWRPFQPGGTVLPGDTVVEQETSFLAALHPRNLTLVDGRVDTLATAQRALQQLADVDLRTLPIGIPLPRWTEDSFNGPEHATINDYLPNLPSFPISPAWYALEDTYLADPTDEQLFALIAALPNETNDGGYLSAHTARLGNCNAYQKAGDWPLEVATTKRRAVLMASHQFRMALLRKDALLEKARAPFPEINTTFNPFFFLGGQNIEPPCYSDADNDVVYAAFPEAMKAEVPLGGSGPSHPMFRASASVAHPWMSLGQIYDQTLLQTDEEVPNKLHYWSLKNFPHVAIHEPFFTSHRVAMQMRYYAEKGSPLWPKVTDYLGASKTHILLDGFRTNQVRLQEVLPASDPRAIASARLRSNIMRAFLLIQRDLLKSGGAVDSRAVNTDFCFSIACQVSMWRGMPNSVAKLLTDPADKALYVDDLAALIDEVSALIQAAPVAK